MKLLVTTAAAALLAAGVAYAEGDAVDAAADANGAAQSTITEAGALDVDAHSDAHAFSALDTDANGGVSLEEAQAFDPSVTATAFGGFDANADGALDVTEYSSWAADMDTSATGQGDASVDSDITAPLPAPDAGVDLDAGADIDAGADLSTGGADLGAGVDGAVGGVIE